MLLAVGSYKNGEWTQIDHNVKERRSGSRACGRGETPQTSQQTVKLFNAYLPTLREFEQGCLSRRETFLRSLDLQD